MNPGTDGPSDNVNHRTDGPSTEPAPATRPEFVSVLEGMVSSVEPHFTGGNARVRLRAAPSKLSDEDAGMQGFARTLWGAIPLLEHDVLGVSRFREGLAHGTDPDHGEYWGVPGDYSQKVPEMSTVACGLLLSDRLRGALSAAERNRVREWLSAVNRLTVYDNNWRLFRVLVNVALDELGGAADRSQVATDLERVAGFYRGDGWFEDGPGGAVDYYTPWGFHFLSLLYDRLSSGRGLPEIPARPRAEAFAREYVHWFSPTGAAVPYGRSLSYRFAQASFWGVLAVADLAALDWDVVRGLWARNVRWWLGRPIFTEAGLLSTGYGYPNDAVTEPYVSACSPYAALKSFLPLLLGSDHPFWRADAAPFPSAPETATQPGPKMVLLRGGDGVTALAAGQRTRHRPDAYNRFAYSTLHGFGIRAARGPDHCDSNLLFSEDGRRYRGRTDVVDSAVEDGYAYSEWQPWPGVAVTSYLVPDPPWHVRVHRVRTDRPLEVVEGGFAVPASDVAAVLEPNETDLSGTLVSTGASLAGIYDPFGSRSGTTNRAAAGTNVLSPDTTLVPALDSSIDDAGSVELACAVLPSVDDSAYLAKPTATRTDAGVTVTLSDGETVEV